jgi:hypothetical protein
MGTLLYLQCAINYTDSTVYAVCYQLYRLYCICSVLSIIQTLLYMQYVINYTDSTVYAVCYQLHILCIQYRPSHLNIFYCVTMLEWTNTVQSYLQLELCSLTFCASLHSATLPTSTPCYSALVFINQFCTTEYANLPVRSAHTASLYIDSITG